MWVMAKSVLELKAVRAGYTVIRGVQSDLYLCVNAAGLLHAVVSHMTNPLCVCVCVLAVLELKAVRAGYTVIRGVKSDLYLCVNAAGLLHAVSVFVDADCSFNEMVQPDGYTHFLSAHHGLPVSLSFNVPPGKHTLTLSRFLPLTTDQFMEKQESAETSSFLSAPDFDSDDPLGVKNTHQNPRSPLFHINQ
ncbi:fibroblast growth factor 21 precursor [Silurus meridionalis]|nr:fibroblast growth factor 21 precursor [Silurus meridionalis]